MRNHLLVAGIAAAALIPTIAFAQTNCERQHENRVAGTVAGGALGAVIGSQLAGHGEKTTGAVLGGLGGAVIGNQVTKGGGDCAHAYGYYDGGGAWHANAVARNEARGYYDRSGRWIDGAPNGSYDSRGTWTSANEQGRYDSQGGWIPARSTAYWNTDGQWVAATAVSDRRYDDRRDGDRRAQRDERDANPWDASAIDFRTRAAWLDEKIQRGVEDGSMSRSDGRRAERSLRDIRRQEGHMRHYDGQLSAADATTIDDRLRDLRRTVRWSQQDSQYRG